VACDGFLGNVGFRLRLLRLALRRLDRIPVLAVLALEEAEVGTGR
jgi:hypothetical protein